MILTLTPNPSIDATLALNETINPGTVHRASQVSQVAGGKGVNVTHAVHLAGVKSVALLPAHKGDHFLSLMEEAHIPFDAVAMPGTVRINTAVTEPNGRTTKINGPGPVLDESVQSALTSSLGALAIGADWVVLAGSLPKGVPTEWYAMLVDAIRTAAPQAKVAVDTSDAPMVALSERLETSAPNLIKPNGLELGQLTGTDGEALEAAAEKGDFSGVVEAARVVVKRGIGEVLVTLGGAGAVLVTADGAWAATPHQPKSCLRWAQETPPLLATFWLAVQAKTSQNHCANRWLMAPQRQRCLAPRFRPPNKSISTKQSSLPCKD